MYKILLQQFIKQFGRVPSALEKILLKQKATKQAIDQRKVLDLKGNPIDPSKPIIGGTQELKSGIMRATGSRPTAVKTEAQIKSKLEGMNKKTIERIKRRRYEAAIKAEKEKAAKDPNYIPDIIDPDDFLAGGGIAGMLGEPTYQDDNHRVPLKGGYLAGGYKDLRKKYKGSDLEAIINSPEINSALLGHWGIQELLTLMGLKKGGRVGLWQGGLAAALRFLMQKYGKDVIKLAKDVKPSKKWDTQKAIQAFKKRNPQFKAEGGRVPMWMGGALGVGKGLLREMLKYFSKGSTHGKSPVEMLKMLNPKQFNEMLNTPGGIPALAKEMIEKYTKTMKKDRADTIGEIISSAKKIKKVDDSVIAHKKWMVEDMVKKGSDRKTAEMFADGLSKAMAKTGKDTPKITERGLLELENIHKNLVTKGRPLNAKGGLARMLGE